MVDPIRNLADIATMGGYEFETACRAFSLITDMDEHTTLCRILTRYKVYVDKRDRSLTPHLMMDGFWETWMTKCLAEIIKPGDTCLDIGANLGYFSVLMSALTGASGQTVAIEPNPDLCKLLRGTAGLNFPGFGVAEVALSDQDGKVVLMIPSEVWGDGSIIDRTDRKGIRKKEVKVKMMRLDRLVKEMAIAKVDVIKMDVEGVEPEVFTGMTGIIENNPGLKIVMEYSPFLYKDAAAFTRLLFEKFEVKRIKDVESPVTIEPEAMHTLIELKDHTDLYLLRK